MATRSTVQRDTGCITGPESWGLTSKAVRTAGPPGACETTKAGTWFPGISLATTSTAGFGSATSKGSFTRVGGVRCEAARMLFASIRRMSGSCFTPPSALVARPATSTAPNQLTLSGPSRRTPAIRVGRSPTEIDPGNTRTGPGSSSWSSRSRQVFATGRLVEPLTKPVGLVEEGTWVQRLIAVRSSPDELEMKSRSRSAPQVRAIEYGAVNVVPVVRMGVLLQAATATTAAARAESPMATAALTCSSPPEPGWIRPRDGRKARR